MAKVSLSSTLTFGCFLLALIFVLDLTVSAPLEDDATRITKGLSGVLDGVRGRNLEKVLRGSFDFTNNGHTKRIANSVIDTVFIRSHQPSSSGVSSSSSSSGQRQTSSSQLNDAVGNVETLSS